MLPGFFIYSEKLKLPALAQKGTQLHPFLGLEDELVPMEAHGTYSIDILCYLLYINKQVRVLNIIDIERGKKWIS